MNTKYVCIRTDYVGSLDPNAYAIFRDIFDASYIVPPASLVWTYDRQWGERIHVYQEGGDHDAVMDFVRRIGDSDDTRLQGCIMIELHKHSLTKRPCRVLRDFVRAFGSSSRHPYCAGLDGIPDDVRYVAVPEQGCKVMVVDFACDVLLKKKSVS